jgi:hypothetical protein
MASQSKGGEKLNKTNHQTLSKAFPNTQKNSFYVALLLLCRISGGAPISL